MVEVYNRNGVSNFKYTIKAVTIFMSRIVLKRRNADHKLLFRKLEKDLRYYNNNNNYIIYLPYSNRCSSFHFTNDKTSPNIL